MTTSQDEKGQEGPYHQERPPLPWVGPSIIALFIIFGCFYVFVQPLLSRPRDRGPSCMSNEKQILLGSFMYGGDYDDHLPLVARWVDRISPYFKYSDSLKCPLTSATYGYALDSRLGDVLQTDFPDVAQRVYVFDSSSGFRSASDPLTSPRYHKGGHLVIGWLDGHASVKSPQAFAEAVAYAAKVKP